ncbi:uncharacterized protein QC761_0028420 [Podospora bellae-mahoneyi]|uniref:Uncharacterized protein n=1 Tax=Podospora bellae-mahoneyi TaxID=2093777 RepID=A0ABR0FSI2_9PEZI|nr:hypothetical protein QC761_0028420 [Podospora bellae-mahoneyi]
MPPLHKREPRPRGSAATQAICDETNEEVICVIPAATPPVRPAKSTSQSSNQSSSKPRKVQQSRKVQQLPSPSPSETDDKSDGVSGFIPRPRTLHKTFSQNSDTIMIG